MLSKSGRAKLDLWKATNVASFTKNGLQAWAQAAEGTISDAADPDTTGFMLRFRIRLFDRKFAQIA
jgi:hypothetical protein